MILYLDAHGDVIIPSTPNVPPAGAIEVPLDGIPPGDHVMPDGSRWVMLGGMICFERTAANAGRLQLERSGGAEEHVERLTLAGRVGLGDGRHGLRSLARGEV